jgi:hypothetical protein
MSISRGLFPELSEFVLDSLYVEGFRYLNWSWSGLHLDLSVVSY